MSLYGVPCGDMVRARTFQCPFTLTKDLPSWITTEGEKPKKEERNHIPTLSRLSRAILTMEFVKKKPLKIVKVKTLSKVATGRIPTLHEAYRNMLRRSYKAVAYAQPAKTTVRNLLRASFRDPNGTLDPKLLNRMGWFLHNAAKENGLEHRIVKNLLLVKFWKDHNEYIARQTWSQLVDKENAQGKAARKP